MSTPFHIFTCKLIDVEILTSEHIKCPHVNRHCVHKEGKGEGYKCIFEAFSLFFRLRFNRFFLYFILQCFHDTISPSFVHRRFRANVKYLRNFTKKKLTLSHKKTQQKKDQSTSPAFSFEHSPPLSFPPFIFYFSIFPFFHFPPCKDTTKKQKKGNEKKKNAVLRASSALLQCGAAGRSRQHGRS